MAIIAQLEPLKKYTKVPLKDLRSVVCRLLWLIGAWHHFRPLLIPLYRALRFIPLTMVGVSPEVFKDLCTAVDSDLTIDISAPLLASGHQGQTHCQHLCGQFGRIESSLHET